MSSTESGHLAERQRALLVEKSVHRLGADVRTAIGKLRLIGLCSWNVTEIVGNQLALLSGSALCSFKRASTAWGLTHGPPPFSPPSVRAATNAGTCAIGAAATAADRRAAPESNSAPWRVIKCGRPSARYRCTSRQPLHKRTRAQLYMVLRLFGDSQNSYLVPGARDQVRQVFGSTWENVRMLFSASAFCLPARNAAALHM